MPTATPRKISNPASGGRYVVEDGKRRRLKPGEEPTAAPKPAKAKPQKPDAAASKPKKET